MSETPLPPRIAKWPFFLGDVLLIAVAFWITKNAAGPLAPAAIAGLVVCMVVGAWLAVQPFLAEYRAQVDFAESQYLHDTVAQIQKIDDVSARVSMASAQLQEAQLQSGKTIAAASQISERMAAEAKSFAEFMAKSNDMEKSHLRLEIEKLRRGEGEHLQILVHMLDHVYALFRAAQGSGQPNLIRQLNQFQGACRDAARRIGLVAVEAAPGEPFDEARHQLADEEAPAPTPGTLIADTLAVGYTYQGQALRRVIVGVQSGVEVSGATSPSPALSGLAQEPLLPLEGSAEGSPEQGS